MSISLETMELMRDTLQNQDVVKELAKSGLTVDMQEFWRLYSAAFREKLESLDLNMEIK